MAGHIQDRWYKTEGGPDGKSRRVKTDRYGNGMRYRARYIGPDGSEKSKSFPDRHRREAELWLAQVRTDMERGQYIDPKSARMTFQQYAERWVASQTIDSLDTAERQIRLHAFPYIGSRPLGTFQPAHIRTWLRQMKDAGIPGTYAVHIYGNVRAVLAAAVDDGFLARNPCSAKSVRPPTAEAKRVIPWLPERVFGIRAALPERYQAMTDVGAGCGLRQGEIFGLAAEAVDFDANTLHVFRQVKLVQGGKPVFAPPKCNKDRNVPLPAAVADRLQAHMLQHTPTEVTLPWKTLDGPPVTCRLIFTGKFGAIRRGTFNDSVWKPSLVAAGVIPERESGERYPAAREHGMHALRHFYASVLLDAGENIKAVSEYLGHADPAMTLRVYAHLMPSSRDRARRALDTVFRDAEANA
ncbi:Site-specific recombinase XerC [Streptomyces sp. 1222.5]|uniref:tyrosine-type recombinase/integrase n=1 Tax=unclassified Streptomyces TaxID=2593676 RepID=UPI00089D73ED|nr:MULTISPECIES: site-specific integrase [unclassified Streptomyces]PKW05590.1 site-specific recombinase XerC [Streptomyces sp. 5112.2]SED34725.1 Site-specific recombinase XerC [Streptomyces sp. 1222.5]